MKERFALIMAKHFQSLELIPEEFRSSLDQGLKILFKKVKGIKAVALVGSVPQGDWDHGSDLDILFITAQRPDFEILSDIYLLLEDTHKHVQLIWFSETRLNQHFLDRTTMAHSLKHSLIIYDPNLLLHANCNQLSGLPAVTWMYNWFKNFDKIYFFERWMSRRYWNYSKLLYQDYITNEMARVVVNLAILFLESCGTVPTTKKKIREGINKVRPELGTGVELALTIRKQDLFLDWDQFCLMSKIARCLRRDLISFFKDNLGRL